MSFVARLLVWIGRVYTGFNLSLEPQPNQKIIKAFAENESKISTGNKTKQSNKQGNKNIKYPKKDPNDINQNKISSDSTCHPISVQFHWPVFTICVSLAQIACFQLGTTYANNGWISEKNFEANHLKRYEAWRIVTSLFVHDGGFHLLGHMVDQIFTGCCLEIVHGWKPVAMVYFGGALISDFWDLIAGTGILGCGASGAISALYAGNLASVILNWKETWGAACRTILLLSFLFGIATGPYWYSMFVDDFGPILELLFGAELDDNISHASHYGGVVAGFVFGICFLKNFRERSWEIKFTKICRCIGVILVVIGIGSLFFNPLFYSKELRHQKINKMKFNDYDL